MTSYYYVWPIFKTIILYVSWKLKLLCRILVLSWSNKPRIYFLFKKAWSIITFVCPFEGKSAKAPWCFNNLCQKKRENLRRYLLQCFVTNTSLCRKMPKVISACCCCSVRRSTKMTPCFHSIFRPDSHKFLNRALLRFVSSCQHSHLRLLTFISLFLSE